MEATSFGRRWTPSSWTNCVSPSYPSYQLDGEGIRLFEELLKRSQLTFVEHHRMGHLLQVTMRL